MNFSVLGEIKAVAFDIDGTLYREKEFNAKIAPHFLRHIYFFANFGIVRKKLRKTESFDNFNQTQAEMMAKRLFCSEEKAYKKIDAIAYSGLEKYFKEMKLCDGALDLVIRLKNAGIKIALLSDFPLEQKGDVWGIKQYCDVMLCSEAIGGLKPSKYVFGTLQQELGIPAEEILYVGNNFKYDVGGPKSCGMKAAWFVPSKRKAKKDKNGLADICFGSYRTLENQLFGDGINKD